ncbi:MAG: FHA domain-containing protein [Planctomycetota bacterium]
MASLLTTTGQRIDISAKEAYSFGRSPDCDIVLADPASSRVHARLSVAGERVVMIEDLKSRNGTYVNDALVTRVLLKDHSRIRIGATTFLLSFVDAGVEASPVVGPSDESLEMTVPLANAIGSESVSNDEPLASKWTESEFAGQLGPFSMVDVLRFLLASRANGTLYVAFDTSLGKIEIRSGEVWDARTDTDVEGDAALIAITEVTVGLFWLVKEPGACTRTIYAPPPMLRTAVSADTKPSGIGTADTKPPSTGLRTADPDW